MHPNPAFRQEDEARALEMARKRGFGVLTVAGPDGLLASHVPFVIEGGEIRAHLVRSNPMAHALKQAPAGAMMEALMIVSGPDGYISPDWYHTADQVPTWNYVAVHLTGALRLLEEAELQPHLEAVSAHNEARLLPKKPWTHHKMTVGVMERMMRQILPVAMEIRKVASTWKLNQNKTEDARAGAADALSRSPVGQDQQGLATLMRTVSTD